MKLLEVCGLSTHFHTRDGVIRAVNEVSFSVDHGQTLGIVGESGSGKSVCCYSLLGLIPCPPGRIESGSAMFEGVDLLQASEQRLRKVRGDRISMIFQDPMTCLNPHMKIGAQIVEPLKRKQQVGRHQARQRALELLDEVGICEPDSAFEAWPHEFSGGMRQRAMIAMALISEPALLIADEPTTALDVTIQKQILELLVQLQKRRGLGIIFVSHDLSVVRSLAQHTLVMESGKIVEQGATETLFTCPQQPYTRTLLSAIPSGGKPSTDASGAGSGNHTLLRVRDLTTVFRAHNSGVPKVAVDQVSFDLDSGEILGLVGESGSGKSTLGRSLLNLVRPLSGSINFGGRELMGLSQRRMKPLRPRMQMIFQDPYASLNPRMSVYDTLAEPMKMHGTVGHADLQHSIFDLMDDVGLARRYVRKYPHEFSGGQRQRIAIGRAIATRPEFVVADEPVSALDVTIQKQILELLLELVERHNLSMLFISHDLAVVRSICDRVMVMNQGCIVEAGDTETLWANPQDSYSQELLDAVV